MNTILRSDLLVASIRKIKNDYRKFLKSKKHTYCGALKRKVSLEKQPEALFGCKNQSNRVPYIFIALDILKKSNAITSRIHQGCKEYEITGLTENEDFIKIHIREEIQHKNKVLMLTTCFRRLKK